MSEERKKVLEMLAKGTISVADAEKLLEKIGEPASAETRAEGHSSSEPSKPRFMRIVIDKPGQDQVHDQDDRKQAQRQWRPIAARTHAFAKQTRVERRE